VDEKSSEPEKLSFEDGMRALERIVTRLEQGDQPLEESLDAFERGVAMLRSLHAKLSEVERRVEVLLRDADGVLRTRDGSDVIR
jgi:exodeoxyribonuclease VII small subunit